MIEKKLPPLPPQRTGRIQRRFQCEEAAADRKGRAQSFSLKNDSSYISPII